MKQQRLLWLCALVLGGFVSLRASGQEPQKKSNVETSEERKEKLDKKLDESLSEFDALILKEQEILEKRREEGAAAGAGGGAGKAEVGGGAEGGEDGEEAAETAEGSGGSPDRPSGEEVASEATEEEASSESETAEVSNGRIPPDVGDGSDDDIVARQLREAAMKEEDPELREKLWDEYRAYKFGQQKKKESSTRAQRERPAIAKLRRVRRSPKGGGESESRSESRGDGAPRH